MQRREANATGRPEGFVDQAVAFQRLSIVGSTPDYRSRDGETKESGYQAPNCRSSKVEQRDAARAVKP